MVDIIHFFVEITRFILGPKSSIVAFLRELEEYFRP